MDLPEQELNRYAFGRIWTQEVKTDNLVSGVALFNRHMLHFLIAAHKSEKVAGG